jgi:serine phosphatase RsbU (regulator of sigma subunit)
MSDPLRNRFHQWLLIFVVGPSVILVLLCNIFLWRLLRQAHNSELRHHIDSATAQIEQVLRGEAMRITTLSSLPGAAALAVASDRREAVQSQDDFAIEELWAKSDRDDIIIRGILDNDVANAFRRAQEQGPQLQTLILTDNRGRLLAATERVNRYLQRDKPWWQMARSALPGVVVSEGIRPDGFVGFSSTVIRPGRSNLVDGVVRAEINLAPVMAAAGPMVADNVVVFILGEKPWQVAGPSNLFARAGERLAHRMEMDSSETGWESGFRYTARLLHGGVTWQQPLRVVAAVAEPVVPLGLFGPMFAAVALGALAVFGLFILALNLGHRLFFDPLREAAEAGVWILRTAYGQAAREGSTALQQPWAEAATEETSVIQQDLAKWLNAWRQELQSQSASISVETKRDLELATEFQQTFLNRAYPRIPEVHVEGRLRLDFYHRYRPALAMGGDFFDIQTLAPDCAGVFVADVMGHGTRSALIVSILRTLIAELSRRGRNAPHFIRELNAEFCSMLKTLPHPFFASAAYFVADTTSRMATYAMAGHPPPFYLHRSVGRVTRLEMPKPQGAALGLLPNEEYGGESVRLNPGDCFIFFTDGVYEAANRRGEEFGLQRLEKLLRANVYRGSREILDGVMDAITHFVGDQPVADDICLVAVDVTTDPVPPRTP